MGLFPGRVLDQIIERRGKMKKYFDYLDHLRDSGVTNMLGAASYLQEAFPELSFNQAQAVYILQQWIAGFGKGGDRSC